MSGTVQARLAELVAECEMRMAAAEGAIAALARIEAEGGHEQGAAARAKSTHYAEGCRDVFREVAETVRELAADLAAEAAEDGDSEFTERLQG